MSEEHSIFEDHRVQLATSLSSVADSLRQCADIAQNFAHFLNDSNFPFDSAARMMDHTSGELDASDKINDASLPHKGKRKVAASPDDGDAPKKRKRITKPKDPNAPKRPASSYIIFQNEVRKVLKEQHPDISNSELLGMIADQWRNMTDEQKETYNQAMKHAKEQYSQDKLAYDSRTPEEVEAANAAAAAALASKKAKPRVRVPKSTANPVPAEVLVRPPPPPREPTPISASEEEDDEDEEDEPIPQKDSEPESDISDSEEEIPPKKGFKASLPPVAQFKASKFKKATKA